jgi:hypothetical protein
MYSPIVVQKSTEKLEAALKVKLKRFTLKECEEMAFRLREVKWDVKGVPSRPLLIDEEYFILCNRLLSKIDFEYFISRFCFIQTDEKKLFPIIPWPSQRKVLDALAKEEERQMDAPSVKINAVLLKSRQIGGTIIGEALIAHLVFLNAMTQGLIASDHPDNSLKLYQTLTRMYDNMPGWLRPVNDGRVKGIHLHFPLLDSDVIVGAGNQKTTLGQGMNIDVSHLTELSTWEFPRYIDEDLMPAFKSSRKHHSVILMESTGAGAKGNWFYEHFNAAFKGESSFQAIFAAWFLRPNNRLQAEGLEFKDTTLDMAKRVKQESGIELDREQLAFYQLTRRDFEGKGELEVFFQEYPSTVEEAFQTGLRSVFPIELRSKLRDNVKSPVAVMEVDTIRKKVKRVPSLSEWVADEDPEKYMNKLVIWELPQNNGHYVISVDASYGILGGDNAAIEVLKVGTTKWLDEQVAEWCGSIDNLTLATVAWVIGHIYRDREADLPALMAVECQPGNPGGTTQIELQRMGYLNFYIGRRATRHTGGYSADYGFWTTPGTRPIITDMIRNYLKRGDLLINSSKFIEEMGSFVNLPTKDGRLVHHLAAAPGYHDDRIMAMAIALYVAHEDDVVSIADERRRKVEAKAKEVKKERVQFWQTMATAPVGTTYESLVTQSLDE